MQAHCRQLGICSLATRAMLMESFCVSHLLAGCISWGHVLGTSPLLRPANNMMHVAARLETAYRSMLRWAIGVRPADRLRCSLLYVLANQIPL